MSLLSTTNLMPRNYAIILKSEGNCFPDTVFKTDMMAISCLNRHFSGPNLIFYGVRESTADVDDEFDDSMQGGKVRKDQSINNVISTLHIQAMCAKETVW